jgi:urease accessory protein UreF
MKERSKGGELAKLAGMWSNERAFWDWVETIQANPCHDAAAAAAFIRAVCGVESRAMLDHDAAARAKFNEHIRKPYARFRASVGCV